VQVCLTLTRPIGFIFIFRPNGRSVNLNYEKPSELFCFDTKDAMIRLDMSEFMEKHSVARMVGAPPWLRLVYEEAVI